MFRDIALRDIACRLLKTCALASMLTLLLHIWQCCRKLSRPPLSCHASRSWCWYQWYCQRRAAAEAGSPAPAGPAWAGQAVCPDSCPELALPSALAGSYLTPAAAVAQLG